jgi:SAM-dependent methyltransferase
LRHRSHSDAESWDGFFRQAGRRALATRAPQDDAGYFASGAQQVTEITNRFDAPVGGTAVEIGCGDGRMTLALADRYDRVWALDAAPTVLAACRRNLDGRPNVEFLLGGAGELAALPAGSADLVLSATVLQHVSDRAEAARLLAEAGRLVRPGGVAALQLRAPGLRSRARDALVDAVRLFGARLPAFHPSWRGAVLSEQEARRSVGRSPGELSWHVDGHHAWLVVSAR